MPLQISDTAATALLTAATVDPAQFDLGSLSIDFIPSTGSCTVRATHVLNVDAATVRGILRTDLTDPEE
jgi:hypothetical protein